MNRIVLVLAFFLVLPSYMKAQESTHFIADHPEYPKYLNGVLVSDIIYPGNDFRRLVPYGEPLERRYFPSGENKSWQFIYDGFRLDYENLYGEPELKRLSIYQSNVDMVYQGEKLLVGAPLKTNIEDASFFTFDRSASDYQKYQGSFQYLEIVVGPNNRITEIIYQRAIRE